jgi:hypothetical protein
VTHARPTAHISPAPNGEVEWKFLVDGVAPAGSLRPLVTVRARSWFAARDLAAQALGVGRDAVTLVRRSR